MNFNVEKKRGKVSAEWTSCKVAWTDAAGATLAFKRHLEWKRGRGGELTLLPFLRHRTLGLRNPPSMGKRMKKRPSSLNQARERASCHADATTITFSQTPLTLTGNRKASIRSPALFLDTVRLGLGLGGLAYFRRTATAQALSSQASCRRAGDRIAKQASC